MQVKDTKSRLTDVDLAYLLDDVPQDPRVVQSHENIWSGDAVKNRLFLVTEDDFGHPQPPSVHLF